MRRWDQSPAVDADAETFASSSGRTAAPSRDTLFGILDQRQRSMAIRTKPAERFPPPLAIGRFRQERPDDSPVGTPADDV
jgi:hypothetical protein